MYWFHKANRTKQWKPNYLIFSDTIKDPVTEVKSFKLKSSHSSMQNQLFKQTKQYQF